jgi:hypothetical protein
VLRQASMVIPPSAGGEGATFGNFQDSWPLADWFGELIRAEAEAVPRQNAGNSIIFAVECGAGFPIGARAGGTSASAADARRRSASAAGDDSCLISSSARAWFETGSNASIEENPLAAFGLVGNCGASNCRLKDG